MLESVIFLTFHGIGKPHSNAPVLEHPYWLEREAFCRALDELQFRSNVQVTFDDGNRSDLEFAVPALKQRSLKGRFFLVSDRIDKAGYLSKGEIKSLIAEGMTVGHHGMYHQRWASLQPAALENEITAAKAILEQICGLEINHSACPFGSYNRRVIKRLRQIGFKRVYTSDGGASLLNEWLTPRNTITRTDEVSKVRGALQERPFSISGLRRRLKTFVKRWG